MYLVNKICYFLILIMAISCVNSAEFDAPKRDCNSDLAPNVSFAELEALYIDETVQIKQDWIIEGYVISSDVAGNFFGVLYIQDVPDGPSYGFQIEIDLRQSHLFFEVGSKVFIKLQGLYLDKKEGTLRLGSPFSAFGNISIGRIPALKVSEHILLSCDAVKEIKPVAAKIQNLDSLKINTLVRFDELEVVAEELDSIFAIAREETTRTLKDCKENKIAIVNSGFSDFQADTLPQGNGDITGILLKDGEEFQLVVRDLNDIAFTNERCPEIITEFTSTRIFISELADPENNTGARFVELYNSAKEPLDLNKWTLKRYTNANTEVSSTIDLSGMIIDSESTLVISPNEEEFNLVYGFAPNLGVSTNSPADSNGDDNLELVDPFGTVMDVFGIVGEDGTSTNHEFEDGRALRNINIGQANPVYTFSEWTIYNDSGDAGTINAPQKAPQDFSPGVR